mmetsp:Transcript_35899/g.83198  ORF Transcript_35899/g.83198 Transcript_35899/m.83198 type:complete len:362 (+) Transcript_35899:137-1222(+)|eukprot:CAMPEP_0179924048 /NCGR_PEP_ID=MMETSP0983-20121128/6508_1 /TAXON_ID=483367 /ORGANISM="non described non described, Strain CCMP 2436" /LENGTH=361 /DNA_ID=CAMNT_0021827523 /DNA_START=148 /DNA_END=1233 /DNA_ORIENTATION=+
MFDLAEVSTKNQLLSKIEKTLSKAGLPIIVELSSKTNTQELIPRLKFVSKKVQNSGPVAEAFAQASSHIEAVRMASSIKCERVTMDADQNLRNVVLKYASDGSASEAEKEQIEADLTRYSELIYTMGANGDGGKEMERGTFESAATPCDKSEEGSPPLTSSFNAIAAALKFEAPQSLLLAPLLASAPASAPATPALMLPSTKIQRFRADSKRMILRAECELDQIAADMQVKVGELRSKSDASKYDSFSKYMGSLWNNSAACALGVLNEQIADDTMRSRKMHVGVLEFDTQSDIFEKIFHSIAQRSSRNDFGSQMLVHAKARSFLADIKSSVPLEVALTLVNDARVAAEAVPMMKVLKYKSL